jgi:hypothetical protein
MKRRLRPWVKSFLTYLGITIGIILAVVILNARFEYLNNCVDEGNTKQYCEEVWK